MDVEELVARLQAPCAPLGVEVVDAEMLRGGSTGRSSSVLRVTVERLGSPLDLDEVADVTAVVSAVLDEEEGLAPSGRYDLEVTSPGLERRLRRPVHFQRAAGSEVALKTRSGAGFERRLQGRLEVADDEGVTLAVPGGSVTVPYAAIESAHTVFDWRAALAESRRGRPGRGEQGRDQPGRGRERGPAGHGEVAGDRRLGAAAGSRHADGDDDDEERAARR